ncbi:MAG: TonB-dependent receptor [Calditrichia bacterium]
MNIYICFFFAALIGFSSGLFAQTLTVSGRVLDNNGETIQDAQISIPEIEVGAFSRKNGTFSFDVSSGEYVLHVEFVGFQLRKLNINVATAAVDMGDIVLQPATVELSEYVVTASRSRKAIEDIPTSINLIEAPAIKERQAKTSAEALREETGVFVQKTNHGGGSAIIRGFSSNRILILVDGIRLNNSTYRLGNHQYLTTIDHNMLNRIEIVRGPTSVLYGSDAIGGTINLVTQQPSLLTDSEGISYNAHLSGRYASADAENSGRAQGAVYNRNFSLSGGYSLKEFGDLRRGDNSDNPLLENSTNGLKQSPSGFSGYDADAKLVWQPNREHNVVLAWQHAEQEEVPRYDKYESGSNITWLYDPQIRTLGYLKYTHEPEISSWFSASTFTASFNRQQEGRITQKRADSVIETENDDTKTFGSSIQLTSNFGRNVLNYGLESYNDRVASGSFDTDAISNEVTVNSRGRYPDDARYTSFGYFVQNEWYPTDKFLLVGGLRYSSFDTEFDVADGAGNGLQSVQQNFKALTGNIGSVYKFTGSWSVSINAGQGFRAPNLSDLAKLGESKGDTYEVPNTDLEPEKILSFDASLRHHNGRIRGELTGFYSRISDLLSSVDATFNGSPIFITGGDSLKVKQKANSGEAYVAGFESSLRAEITPNLSSYASLSFSYGQNTSLDEPIGKMPPMFGRLGLRWQQERYWLDGFTRFAAKQDRLSADDLDDDRIPTGGTPGWQIITLRGGVTIFDGLVLRTALENIFDVNYREHASGINAAGRNFVVSCELVR